MVWSSLSDGSVAELLLLYAIFRDSIIVWILAPEAPVFGCGTGTFYMYRMQLVTKSCGLPL